jgi:MFS family permease
MSLAHRRAIWILGLSQCVLWGILYYGYSIWQEPLVQTLGASRTAIAGAFSAGLGIMALLAPWIGRRIDEGRIIGVVRLGLALAVAGLALLSQSRNVPMVYAAYVLLGFAMASLLYETAFGLVTRAVADEHQRLGALSTVTIFGGLASTVFLPLLAWASDTFGWRATGTSCRPSVRRGLLRRNPRPSRRRSSPTARSGSASCSSPVRCRR